MWAPVAAAAGESDVVSRSSSIEAEHAGLAPELPKVRLTAQSAAKRSEANVRTRSEPDPGSYEPSGSRWIEPLMGWAATDDPFAQIRLTFPMLAAAVD